MQNAVKIKKYLIIYLIGAVFYPIIEILYSGNTHWTMSIAGGICFIFVYIINSRFNNFFVCCTLSALAITLTELDIGMIVNYYLNLHVWNYSLYHFNFMGQICLLYSFFWLLLSVPMYFLCSFLRKKLG